MSFRPFVWSLTGSLVLCACGVDSSTASREDAAASSPGRDGATSGPETSSQPDASGADGPEPDASVLDDASGGLDAATEPEAPASALLAPEMTGIMVMGGLHMTWVNKQPDCEAVEGERKSDVAPYAPLFSVAGTKTSYVDKTATQNMTYTYHVRCKKGAEYSVFSNEVSGNPTQ
jgi:hypothetical protein